MKNRKKNDAYLDMNNKIAFARILPVVLALSPVGFLFGILAAQADWRFVDVFLMSLIGFTGSGQFAYLSFAHPDNEEIQYFTVFLIILCINLRYIPMSLSASRPISGSAPGKAVLAHWLADESYAVEQKEDGIGEKIVIRLSVVAFWTLSTSFGVLLSGILPITAREILAGLTFPISAILILLSLDNIFLFIGQGRIDCGFNYRKLSVLGLCICASVASIVLIGPKYFWIPGIVLSYLLLSRYAEVRHE